MSIDEIPLDYWSIDMWMVVNKVELLLQIQIKYRSMSTMQNKINMKTRIQEIECVAHETEHPVTKKRVSERQFPRKRIDSMRKAMFKKNIGFIMIILASTASVGYSCDKKIRIIDPSVSLGTLSCTDHGNYTKGCSILQIICTLTPLEVQKHGDCYHMECKWQDNDLMNIKWVIKPPYTNVHVDMYPKSDISPVFSLIVIVLLLSIACCMASSNDPFIAGVAGGALASGYSSSGYSSSTSWSSSSSRG